VHDALRDPLAVEVADLLEELVVLERRRSARPDGARVLVVVDRVALTVGQDRTVVVRGGRLRCDVGHGSPRVVPADGRGCAVRHLWVVGSGGQGWCVVGAAPVGPPRADGREGTGTGTDDADADDAAQSGHRPQ
jgi:hypothetical protein